MQAREQKGIIRNFKIGGVRQAEVREKRTIFPQKKIDGQMIKT